MILHSPQDPFASTEQNVDLLTLSDRKVAQKNLHIVQFVGVPPPPSQGMGMWVMLDLVGASFKERGLIDLVIDASKFPGTISLVLPPPIFPKNPKLQAVGFRRGSTAIVKKWIRLYTPVARRIFCEAKYQPRQHKRLIEAMEKVADQAPLVLTGGRQAAIASLPIARRDVHTVFLRIDPPPKSKIGSEWTFDVNQVDAATKKLLGGSRYKVVVNRKA